MAKAMTRRETLKRGIVAAGALALVPEWALPALAQGEVDVPFTDIPATFNPSPADGARRFLDLRKIDGLLTPTENDRRPPPLSPATAATVFRRTSEPARPWVG